MFKVYIVQYDPYIASFMTEQAAMDWAEELTIPFYLEYKNEIIYDPDGLMED